MHVGFQQVKDPVEGLSGQALDRHGFYAEFKPIEGKEKLLETVKANGTASWKYWHTRSY